MHYTETTLFKEITEFIDQHLEQFTTYDCTKDRYSSVFYDHLVFEHGETVEIHGYNTYSGNPETYTPSAEVLAQARDNHHQWLDEDEDYTDIDWDIRAEPYLDR